MNIVLIGFKASGKSTLGRMAAQAAGKRFVDSDALVEALARDQSGESLSCREIYSRYGAARMRELESLALRSLADRDDTIVATGGGAILDEENRRLLKRAGLCVFLDTPLADLEKRLASQADSPLFQNLSVKELHSRRYPLYAAAADKRCALPQGADEDACARILLNLIQEAEHGQ